MTFSPGREVRLLKDFVGKDATVRATGNLAKQTKFEIRCRYCSTPNPGGGEGIKVKFVGPDPRVLKVEWAAHEASRSHEVEKGRAASL